MSIINKMKKIIWNLPTQRIIVFESIPEFACNTYPVYLELRRILPNYKMVWLVPEGTKNAVQADAIFSYDGKGAWCEFRRRWYTHFAKAFISSNRIYEKKRPEQVALFLCHGSKTKRTKGYYEVGEGIDYVNVQSHFFDDIITYEYNCPREKLVYLGYPRCDWFFEPEDIVKEKTAKLLVPGADRYLVWLPTFRKHKRSLRKEQMDAQKYSSMGMPLVYTPEDLQELNEYLVKTGICILYKPHPAQDTSMLKAANLSNIQIINDQNLAEQGLQLYEVLAGSSGLITDYSSVYFDYLLLDRPIATTTDDIEEWKKMTGFAFDLDAFYDRSTIRCPDLNTLKGFLSDIQSGKDEKAAGRAEIRELTNLWNDGNSAKRVAYFIAEKIRQ